MRCNGTSDFLDDSVSADPAAVRMIIWADGRLFGQQRFSRQSLWYSGQQFNSKNGHLLEREQNAGLGLRVWISAAAWRRTACKTACTSMRSPPKKNLLGAVRRVILLPPARESRRIGCLFDSGRNC